ncbi:3-oxoacyl-[acyl-carrier-protein] reductase-like [Haemaphysalis longicornis]
MAARAACVVFGGTRGIGLAVARRFLRAGCPVAVFSRDRDNVEAAVEQLSSSGPGAVHGHCCDVRNEASVQEAMAWAEQEVGPVRYLVTSAGINLDRLLVQTSEAEMRSVLDTNLVGSLLCCRAALKAGMLRRREGSIVTVGSVVGAKGNAGQTVYASSKAALVGLTRSLAKELASRNITVNMVQPGFIDTGMTRAEHLKAVEGHIPLKRPGGAEEVAEAVHFLATSGYVTGQVLPVDGGLRLAL